MAAKPQPPKIDAKIAAAIRQLTDQEVASALAQTSGPIYKALLQEHQDRKTKKRKEQEKAFFASLPKA